MEVLVKPHRAFDPLRREEIDTGQYRIEIDGRLAGYLGYHDGARPMLLDRRSPIELRQIEAEIRRQVEPQQVGDITQVPEKPQPAPPKPVPDLGAMYG